MDQESEVREEPSRSAVRRVTGVLLRVLAGFLGFLIVGNLLIVGAWKLNAAAAPAEPHGVEGVDNFRVVDDRVWRGGHPEGAAAYRSLAEHGVTTVVDLRAEDDIDVDRGLLEDLGVRWVHLPIRDGQVPSDDEVAAMLDAIAESEGPTFVHCGAGVGRTGAMVAAYQVAIGAATPAEAMFDNLAVGPPSLEQLAFAASLAEGPNRPPALVVAVSRVLDAPRRIWTYF
jgi:protein tyrosine phosphatase (PTP) superfamily phosphohydrolase (DUF442 family)